MDLDTRHLRALVAVVDEGTFTDAAIAFRTSQASVSRSIQRLEAQLGLRLLDRSTRHVETTTAGDQVLCMRGASWVRWRRWTRSPHRRP